MKNLHLVEDEDRYLERILSRLGSSDLIWLCWYKRPSSSLHSWKTMEKLKALQVGGRNLKLLWQRESQVPLQLPELKFWAPLSDIPKTREAEAPR